MNFLAFVPVLGLCWGFACSVAHEAECEVCTDYLDRFYHSLLEKNADFTPAAIEKELTEVCRKSTGKENRLCYYLGATSDAATKILGEVTRPMSAHVPTYKICEKLRKIDMQICELKYGMFGISQVVLCKYQIEKGSWETLLLNYVQGTEISLF
ncbi:hypothetical protein XENTR_v10008816 [Xenopus tropicalis]|nr:hypothetical protein XENTR_v10008816 [Xenopus tropicalis]